MAIRQLDYTPLSKLIASAPLSNAAYQEQQLGLRDLLRKDQAGQMNMDEAQRQQKVRDAAQRVLGDPSLSPDERRQRLYGIDFTLGQAFDKAQLDNQKEQVGIAGTQATTAKTTADTAKIDQENAFARLDKVGGLAQAVKQLPPERRQPAWVSGLQNLSTQGVNVGKFPPQVPEDADLDALIGSVTSAKDQMIQAREQAQAAETNRHNIASEADNVAQRAEVGRHNLATEATANKETPFSAWRKSNPKAPISEWYKVTRSGQQPSGGSGAATDLNDAKDIAKGVMEGRIPPDLTGYYRNKTAISAELARNGFNVAEAERDWKSINKHLATLNGAQQERLRQAVTFTYDSLDNIEGLYSQWKQAAGVSGIKLFNKAALAAAKEMPGEAGSIATSLEAQIADLTSELGTVYKGGNASTDETLKLAAKNLEANWNEQTFNQALKQIRTNLGIRRNSIMTSQPAGVKPDSPYNPPTPNPSSTAPVVMVGPDGKEWNVPADKITTFEQNGYKKKS